MALPAPPPKPQPTSVGSAYMQPNGTLEMSLRTETQDGTIGEAFLVIPKGDPRYADMVKHLGDIKPGRGKGDTAIPGAGTKLRRQAMTRTLLIALALAGATDPCARRPGPAACPDKNVMYWQAFPPGGESDLSARHQQLVLKKKCPASRRSSNTSRARAAR